MLSISSQVNSGSLDMLLEFTTPLYTFIESKEATQSFDYIVCFFLIRYKKSLAQTRKYIETKPNKTQGGTFQILSLELTKLI